MSLLPLVSVLFIIFLLCDPNTNGSVYFDGQMDDSRLNVAIACTAALAGASMLNHAEVVSLNKDKISGHVIGAHIRDHLIDEEFDVYAKVVVNAVGPFSDSLRKMANNGATNIISPSSGAYVVLPNYFTPKDMGLIIPKTKDARVVFMLPRGGKTLVGTTDTSSIIIDLPKPHEKEIEFILSAIGDYLNIKVQRSDILSTWSGIRSLATDPSSKDTSNISRDHIVNVKSSGLITIAGGKWTTYRRYYIFLFCMVRLKDVSMHNQYSRSYLVVNHCAGSKSFLRIRADMSVDLETQQEAGMIAMGEIHLKKKLGQYILGDLDLEQLDVQLGYGTLQLTDLALNVDYINQKESKPTDSIPDGTIECSDLQFVPSVLVAMLILVCGDIWKMNTFRLMTYPRTWGQSVAAQLQVLSLGCLMVIVALMRQHI
ncbi:hypothetical protein IFM89_034281 [Coptis chinensis]|uniref:glycerol-3-phosphate dehydrogenase n=1 Tax=Coptis chinensis TaxID=261450 RepID=A0A835ISM1_9MAGN|nr:hypothetical protein IFM89_034281 [Coptis chinensis]